MVQHSLHINLFRPFSKGSYLAFLRRLTAEKGPEKTIRIASAAYISVPDMFEEGETRESVDSEKGAVDAASKLARLDARALRRALFIAPDGASA